MADSLEIAKQLIELKTQLNELKTPEWQKILTAFSPLIGALIGWLIAINLFWLNKRKDAKKEIENRYIKIYSELTGVHLSLINEIQQFNYHKIYSNQFYAAARLLTNQIEKERHIKSGDDSFDKYLKSRDRYVELTSVFNKLIGEYKYTNSSTNISQYYTDLFKENYDFDSSNKYESITNVNQIREISDKLFKELDDLLNGINKKLTSIIDCIKNETT